MRRIIRNSTAIAACLSLLLPQLSQAWADAPVPEGQAADRTTMPLLLAQAERDGPPVRRGQSQPPERQGDRQGQPQAERKPQRAGKQAQAEKPGQGRDKSNDHAARESGKGPEQARQPAAQRAAAQPQDEQQPRGNAKEKQERPARQPAQQERRPAPPQERADQKQQNKTPGRAEERARPQPNGEARSGREQADRREQAPRKGDGQRAGAGNQQANAPAQRQQRSSEGRAPRQQADDAGGRQQARQPAARPAGNARNQQPLPEVRQDQQQTNMTTLREGAAQRASQQEPRQNRKPQAVTLQGEAARRAARETRAARAAALNEDRQGRIVEQRITRENSRSSDEDFQTNLRDVLRARDQQRAEARADNDDDRNDLVKALLLGLGTVAVGSYLNNNRQVALATPDRVVVTEADGSQQVIKDEVALLRQPGSTVTTENFDDGSSRTVVTRADGSRVVTIRDADLRVLRRTLISPDGSQTRLIDDTAEVEPVDIATLPAPAPIYGSVTQDDEAALREALRSEVDIDRRFTLEQVRSISEVRSLVPPVNIDAITFDSGSAAISPDQARQLSTLGNAIQDAIAENRQEIFLIEGHTDLVGSDAANLALSDRRAESVALALSEYFQVPPENLVVQGYGEQYPQVRREGDIRENRRATVRRITDLLQTADAQ